MMDIASISLAGIFLLLAGGNSGRNTPPNDAQIAAIVVTANQADIDAGTLAKSSSADKEVRAFAERLTTDFASVKQSASELFAKLKVRPEDSPTSSGLKTSGDDNIRRLRALKGPAFDDAYMSHEVEYHKTLIDTLDTDLIPNATNHQLKVLLVRMRPAFLAHLEYARWLQDQRGLKKAS